ncbi:hypothetical protein LCGC14_2556760, partial [marine sediment metagenome]
HQKNPVEGIAIAVLGATGPCPDCGGTECVLCDCTGKVFALDPLGTIGVRVECSGCCDKGKIVIPQGGRVGVSTRYVKEVTCRVCDGRGWVPTNDAWKLLEAVLNAFDFVVKIETRLFDSRKGRQIYELIILDAYWESNEQSYFYGEGKTLGEAFFEALSKALVAQGYTLGE